MRRPHVRRCRDGGSGPGRHERLELAHCWSSPARDGRSTRSPGGSPEPCSLSSADCSTMTADALSMRDRDWRVERPLACRPRWACTVESRSSIRRTGTSVRSARAAGPVAGRAADCPLLPAHVQREARRTTSIASHSLQDRQHRARPSRRPPERRPAGTASIPVASLRATPIRTEPTSQATRTPGRTGLGSRPLADERLDGLERRRDPSALVPPPCAKSSLPPPRPPMLGAAAWSIAPAVTPERDRLRRTHP